MTRRDAEAADQNLAAQDPGPDPAATAQPAPAALYAAGFAHLAAGRQLEAQLCCEQALALDGDHADTLHLLRCLALLRIHAL